MFEFTVDSTIGERLAKLPGEAVVCDADGRVLGFFSPTPDHPSVKDLQLEPPWSIAESKEMCKEKSGKPLSEILNRLGVA